jgi:hypothetical protein
MNIIKPQNMLLSKKYIGVFVLLFIAMFFLFKSCVEEYTPVFKSYEDLLVVDGSIKKGEPLQYVYLSRSTSINHALKKPVSNCQVYVIDQAGNQFNFREATEGTYVASISEEYLKIGNQFQLNITTGEGSNYQSSFETLLESSPVDSVYYAEESSLSENKEVINGLQFYTDLKAPESATKNYLWTIEETWEIRTYYEILGYYLKSEDSIYFRPVDSLNRCWSTRLIPQYFTSTTANLMVNEKKKVPLNYMPGDSEKINYKYSILVKQFALSGGAYNFWYNNFLNTQEAGSLYEGQPVQSVTNITNINNPSERVLGYFWASSYTEKRILFTGPLINIFKHCSMFVCAPPCNMKAALRGTGRDIVYFTLEGEYYSWPIRQICINCLAEGGTDIKPDFWE